MNSVAFTGYRPEKFPFSINEKDADYIAFYNELYKTIESLATENSVFLCGGAMGFDIIAGEIVLKIKEKNPTIKLFMVLPFKKQESNFTPNWKARYDYLLKKCYNAIYVENDYKTGCYFKRNRYLVDNASTVVTYYNGKPGGTKYTVNYAEKKKRKIINICK